MAQRSSSNCWMRIQGVLLALGGLKRRVAAERKQKSGFCRVDEFRGVLLVAVPYKALCSIVQKRMVE